MAPSAFRRLSQPEQLEDAGLKNTQHPQNNHHFVVQRRPDSPLEFNGSSNGYFCFNRSFSMPSIPLLIAPSTISETKAPSLKRTGSEYVMTRQKFALTRQI
jgi:hypothetical protein